MIAQAIKNHVKRVWKGEEPFWKVFLIWWVAGTFIVVTIIFNLLSAIERIYNKTHTANTDIYLEIISPLIFLVIPTYFFLIVIVGTRSLHHFALRGFTRLIMSALFLIFTCLLYILPATTSYPGSPGLYGLEIWNILINNL